jgi:glutathione peroxidase
MTIHDFSARLNTGEEQSLSAYQGKVLLVVNTASECGFTSQYAGLQALQDRFGPRGFTVLAFPCNQFGGQEPHSDAEIASFCERKFRTTFPLFAKIDVNGRGAHPLYTWLKSQKRGLLGRDIRWNFTKYLVDRDGTVLARFAPATKPERIAAEIEDLLA